MTKQEREILTFMARILLDVSRGFPIDIEDIWKLDSVIRELETEDENNDKN